MITESQCTVAGRLHIPKDQASDSLVSMPTYREWEETLSGERVAAGGMAHSRRSTVITFASYRLLHHGASCYRQVSSGGISDVVVSKHPCRRARLRSVVVRSGRCAVSDAAVAASCHARWLCEGRPTTTITTRLLTQHLPHTSNCFTIAQVIWRCMAVIVTPRRYRTSMLLSPCCVSGPLA